MSSNFPTSLDTFPAITAATLENAPGVEHDVVHVNVHDAIAALQAKVGVDGSAVATSIDYILGLKAPLASPTFTGTVVSGGDLSVVGTLSARDADISSPTFRTAFNNIYGVSFAFNLTDNRTVTWPDATGTVALAATTLAGYGITDAQTLDATLTALAGQNWAANSLAIGSGADTVAQVTFAANTFPGRSSSGNLIAKAIADASFTHLATGLGTISTQASNSVVITGGTINGTSIGATVASTGVFTTVSADDLTVITDSLFIGLAQFGTGIRTQDIEVDSGILTLNDAIISATGLTGSRTFTLPNSSGTFALVATTQPLDATLTALAGQNWAANSLAIGSGADTVAQVTFAANTFPGRSSSGDLAAKTISDDALAFLAAANDGAMRTELGLGNAATQNTGTSGANVPLLNGNNTWSGTNTFTSTFTNVGDGSTNAVLQVNGAAGSARRIDFLAGGANRWRAAFDSGAESGGNAGSDLLWQAFDDSGAVLGTFMSGSRANRTVQFPAGIIGTPVGATTPSTGAFTTLSASGNVAIGTNGQAADRQLCVGAGVNTGTLSSDNNNIWNFQRAVNSTASAVLGIISGNAATNCSLNLGDTDNEGQGGLAYDHTTDAMTLRAANANVVAVSAKGFGYVTGMGGTVTQATNKSTGVTLNKSCGDITMNGAALAAATIVSFTLTNSAIEATDVLMLNHVTTGTRGAYTLNAQCAAGSAVIYVRNNTAGSLSEAIVIRFTLMKGVTA